MSVQDVQVLRDLFEIPDAVHAGDFVLTLSKGVGADSTVRDYVVTEQLAGCFDQALGLIQSAVEGRTSRAAYLDGSFGSGKSHFMAVLHAVLRGDPEARKKKGLVQVVAKHDRWLKDRSFLLVPFHMIEATSLESAVLGGYVDHVRKLRPDAPPPAVYRDEGLLADARRLRARLGDEAFIAGLPAAGGGAETGADAEWVAFIGSGWDAASLDAAFAAPPGHPDRRNLVTALLSAYYEGYSQVVSGTADAFIELDKGLAEISRHARDVLGYDAIVLLLDELVLWLSSYIGDPIRIKTEAQKVSKLVESAEHDRPAPIVSFVPRQRDLRDLVGRDVAGATTASLFDTLKYWDGRFDTIKLEDRNLPVIVEARLLRPRNTDAKAAIDAAFDRTTAARPEVWEALLDAQGGAADRDSFRATYPFSPAFLHAMVDISGALQRQRTALKLMQKLLVDYRDVLPAGRLMPMGAIYDVLADGEDRPFTDKLRDEFTQAKTFYTTRLLPYLLGKHNLTDDELRGLPARHAFRADDLVVKTLLLAALVPNVPALRSLTATRLAALNHGSIATMIPGQDRQVVSRTLRALAAEFGEIRVGPGDDPTVEVALIGVDTGAIMRDGRKYDDDSARRRLIRRLLWEEFGAQDRDDFVTSRPLVWRGTDRVVELVFGNVRDRDNLADDQFRPELPGALRVVVDYPFEDEGSNHTPAEDRSRMWELQAKPDPSLTLAWLPSHLSRARLGDLGDLVIISHVLERRDRLEELTAHWAADDRHHARMQLESRRAALTTRLMEALKRAYGVARPDDADLGARIDEHVMAMDSRLEIKPPAGLALGDALDRICGQLLDHAYPRHPDFDAQGRRKSITRAELGTVLRAVEQAAQNKVGRLEVPRADLPALKRIANPLDIATVGEVFVLRDEWKLLIGRRAAQSGSAAELRAGDVRRWIAEEQPGLPGMVVDLLIACYAIQDDRAWLRAGRPIPAPELGRITSDMVLRRQDLPSEQDFQRANELAEGLFGVSRQPVCSARAVQTLAEEVLNRVAELTRSDLSSVDSLVRFLESHADTLGLTDESERLVITRTVAGLLTDLAVHSEPTALVNKLAEADLPGDLPSYRATLDNATRLDATFNALRWQILDQLPALAAGRGPKAEAARAILDRLRGTAAHNEQAAPLGRALRDAEQAAIQLIIEPANDEADEGVGSEREESLRREQARLQEELERQRAKHQEELEAALRQRLVRTEVESTAVVTRSVKADGIGDVVAELRKAADANPDATFEVVWRIVES